MNWNAAIASARKGSDADLARLISALEANNSSAICAMGQEANACRRRSAPRIGVTGAAGAGKSTLLAAIVENWPGAGRIGAIGIDPSSEASGGAFLGDRFRLYRGKPSGSEQPLNLFFRSMGARGGTGALSQHIGIVSVLFDIVGVSPILIETAGAGQGDVAVRELVDLLVLVLTPESGDTIQMLKAGQMESADIYVVNKSDRSGATDFARKLRGIVGREHSRLGLTPSQRVQLVQANGADRQGVKELTVLLHGMATMDTQTTDLRWHRAANSLVEVAYCKALARRLSAIREHRDMLESVHAGRLAPESAADRLLELISHGPVDAVSVQERVAR